MKRVPRILLSVAVFCGLLLAIEGGLRCAGWSPRSAEEFRFQLLSDSERANSGQYVRHPQRFYSLGAHYRASAAHAGRYALGSWPFRGRPPFPAPAGTLRVAVVGDSCVYGAGLDVSETLSEQLQQALEERGFDPARTQVLNFGVPGYSTVQIGAMVNEIIAMLHPAAIVMYPAAWNDQGPALGDDDPSLYAKVASGAAPPWFESTATLGFLRHLVASERSAIRGQEILEGWRRGAPPLGYRVPKEKVGEQVRGMIRACRRAGVEPLVLVPSQPIGTQEKYPRVLEDAGSVRTAARDARTVSVDVDALFAALEANTRETMFVDFIHPSGIGVSLIVEQVAPLLAQLLGAPERAVEHTGIRELSPRCSTLGDERIRVSYDTTRVGNETPLVLVGGAPLLDLRRIEDGVWEGTNIANGPGRLDVAIRTSKACLVAESAIESLPPTLELLRDASTWKIRFHSRPGDTAIVLATTQCHALPKCSELGRWWLVDASLLQIGWKLVAADDGVAEVEIARPWLPKIRTVFLQATVVPRGEEQGRASNRFTNLIEVNL